ncbi:MAG: PAS domain S-box protein [Myxococcota bacterium]
MGEVSRLSDGSTATHDAVVFEAHGETRVFRSVSQGATRVTGHPPERWLAEPEFWLKHIHPDDRAHTAAEQARALREGGTHTMEYRFLRDDGASCLLRDHMLISGERIQGVMWDVTLERGTLTALEESRARYHGLAETAFDGVVVVQDGRVVECNSAFAAMYGAGPERVVGRMVTDLVAPESLPTVLAHMRASFQGRYEAVGLRADGSRIALEICARECVYQGRPARLVAQRDLTNVKRVQAELQRQTALYEAILRAQSDLGEGLALADAVTGKLIHVNDAMSTITGHAREELLGLPSLFALVPPDERPVIAERMSQRLRGNNPPSHYESVVAHKAGLRVPIEVAVKGVMLEGSPHSLALVRDVTERHRHKQALLQTQKLESVGVLAGGIAHDFNNLLSVILGHAVMAAATLEPEHPAREWLDGIETASTRAAELCQQLLAYAGRGKLETRRVDLSELVQEMTKLLQVSITGGARIEYALASVLPPVEADPTQLRQVVMNLVMNANEALVEGKGTITVRTGVLPSAKADAAQYFPAETLAEGSYVFVEVQDTGCGMDAATRERIFDPFFSTKFTGRGLGLAAVLGVARGHRGALRVESAPGQGSLFRLVLPAAAGTVETTPEATPTSWHAQGTVLVVDDDEGVRHLVKRVLERAGLQVVVARGGADAVQTYAERRGAITAAVVDLTMPGMDGVEVLRRLRELDPRARVLLMSGYNPEPVTEKLVASGNAGFLRKPFRPEQLHEAMRLLLEPASARP